MVHIVQTEDDFKKQLADAGSKLVVVDFYATWCGPCKMIAPKIEAMAAEMPNVVFLKVDVDELDELAAGQQVTCMPTFLFFKNGQKVDSFAGANHEKIKSLVEKHQ